MDKSLLTRIKQYLIETGYDDMWWKYGVWK